METGKTNGSNGREDSAGIKSVIFKIGLKNLWSMEWQNGKIHFSED